MWMIMKAWGRDKVGDVDAMPILECRERGGESMDMQLDGERSM
jgi:hypothetical protein